MAKTNITQYSSTPSSNTDINNINIDENCPASGLNNAIRELMAHLKNVDTGSQALTALSVSGDTTISSGNLLVGKTSTGLSVTGTQIQSDGRSMFTRDGNQVADFNRKTSDGDIVKFYKDGTTVGSIGVDNSDNLFIEGNSTHAGLQFGTDVVIPHKNGAIVDDVVVLGQANNRFVDLYLSGGVYLGGTGSDNLLDDYEEGTWTPTLDGSTSNPSGTASATQNVGFYTKIGRMVMASFRVEYTSVSGGSGSFRIAGLPFNVISNSNYRSSGNVSFFRGVTHGGNRLAPHANQNTDVFSFYKNANATEFDTAITIGDLSSTVTLHGHVMYMTS